jgi:hypothetical protein
MAGWFWREWRSWAGLREVERVFVRDCWCSEALMGWLRWVGAGGIPALL